MNGLFETMRWEDGHLHHADRHLARLARSARHYGLPYSAQRVVKALAALPPAAQGPQLVRVELSAEGQVTVTPRLLLALPVPLTLGFSSLQVASGDEALRHKRLDRRLYEEAYREAQEQGFDDVILSNEHGHLTETSRFSLFCDPGDGLWRTPRTASGLLPGILRAVMLEAGHACEADLEMDDVLRAYRVAVGNSARGLLVARVHSPSIRG